jgi:hypothetical protein
MDTPNKNGEKRYKRRKDGTFDVGHSGGPGRPKGSLSIKDLVRQHLEEHPDDLKQFVAHFIRDNRELAWQMLEGRPPQDVTSAGEKINPIPIYNGLSGHDSDKEDIQSTKED